jgi:myo-inositol-1(or 4)-monophosphatase
MALSPNMNVMIRAAEKAAKSLLRDFGEVEQLQVSRKGPGDFVTNADKRAEEILYKELSTARPDFGFLMEESGVVKPLKGDGKTRWIIDPLDGTLNFLHGVPHWAISIGLEENNEITAGIIYDPIRDELFRAEKGAGAFARNKRLRVSGRNNIEIAMVATGSPPQQAESRDVFLNEYCAVQKRVPGIRRFGSAALDMAYVAAGRLEAFWERDLHPWDMAAGHLIVKEAQGRSVNIAGTSDPVFAGNVLCSNGLLHDELKLILAKAQD